MYKKILVAIDDSETSRCALKEALHIAKCSDAKLYISHVTDDSLLNVHGHVFAHMAESEAARAITTLSEAGQKLLVDAMLSADGINAEALLLSASNRNHCRQGQGTGRGPDHHRPPRPAWSGNADSRLGCRTTGQDR